MAVAPPLLVRVLGCLYNMILVGLCTHATLLKAYFVALFGIVIVLYGQTDPTYKRLGLVTWDYIIGIRSFSRK